MNQNGMSLTFRAVTRIPSCDLLIRAIDEPSRVADAQGNAEGARAIELGDFTGSVGQTARFYPSDGPAKRLVLVGCGKSGGRDIDCIRKLGGSAANLARTAKASQIVVALPTKASRLKAEPMAEALAQGMVLSGFRFNELKSDVNGSSDDGGKCHVSVLAATASQSRQLRKGLDRGVIVAESANYARTLAARPGNVINPVTLAAEAKRMASRVKLQCRILAGEQLKKLNMGGLIAVGGGSANKSRLIILEHAGRGAGKPIVIVGKGITFDTGGVSIKSADKMDRMKYDKCGAMATMGIMAAVARLRLRHHVIGLVPTAENVLSSTAYRPGDIIRFHNGKTAEVLNTDAEGRLVLADALSYAQQFKPRAVIDMATLTGAVVVALGSHAAAICGTDEKLIAALKKSGEYTGEPLWQLPLWEKYSEQVKGDHADLKNIGGREGGTITAAAFLKEFVGEVPWAHLDIAGTAWTESDQPYISKGPTAAGTRLVCHWLQNLS